MKHTTKIKINKHEYIKDLAVFLSARNILMSAKELAENFNRNGIKTNLGHQYDINGRGIYKVIGSAWDKYSNNGNNTIISKAIASVFVNDNNEFVYE